MAKRPPVIKPLPDFMGTCGDWDMDECDLTLMDCLSNCLPDGKLYQITVIAFSYGSQTRTTITGRGRVTDPDGNTDTSKPWVYKIEAEYLHFSYSKA